MQVSYSYCYSVNGPWCCWYCFAESSSLSSCSSYSTHVLTTFMCWLIFSDRRIYYDTERKAVHLFHTSFQISHRFYIFHFLLYFQLISKFLTIELTLFHRQYGGPWNYAASAMECPEAAHCARAGDASRTSGEWATSSNVATHAQCTSTSKTGNYVTEIKPDSGACR